jgi:hypothetical protein
MKKMESYFFPLKSPPSLRSWRTLLWAHSLKYVADMHNSFIYLNSRNTGSAKLKEKELTNSLI